MSNIKIKQGEPTIVVGDTYEGAIKRANKCVAELRESEGRTSFSIAYAVILTPLVIEFESLPVQRSSKRK